MANGLNITSKVKIADIIEPSIFTQYVIERTTAKSALWKSGIISSDPRIDGKVAAGGRTVNMPFWTELTGTSEILDDSTPLTPQKIGTAKDVAVVQYRGNAWAANDLAEAVAGDDPMAAIVNQTADYWAKVFQQEILNNTLKGIFATALATSHTKNIAIEDGNNATAANKFSDSAFLDAAFLLGDHEDEFTALAVHSVVMRRMLDLNLIEYVQPSSAEPRIATYRGRQVLVDDQLLKVAGGTSGQKYYSFLFGPGAIGYGEAPFNGAEGEAVEVGRDILAGDDVLVHRRQFILHPRGIAFTGTPAGAAPSNAELATGGNWTKKYQDKHIRIAALVTNG